MGAILGQDFMMSIIVSGTPVPICHATDFTMNEEYGVREISGPQGFWKDYIGDYCGYNLQVPGVVAYNDAMNILQLKGYARNRAKLAWSASAFTNGGVVDSGFIIITAFNVTSQFRDAYRFDMTAIGCGEPITQLLPIIKQVHLGDFFGVILAGCPDPYPVTIFWYDGTMIGPADNADDVISTFNAYSASHGNYYTLQSSVDGGCQFIMAISYLAPLNPDYVIALPGASFAISTDQSINNILSTDQDSDNVLTPIG